MSIIDPYYLDLDEDDVKKETEKLRKAIQLLKARVQFYRLLNQLGIQAPVSVPRITGNYGVIPQQYGGGAEELLKFYRGLLREKQPSEIFKKIVHDKENDNKDKDIDNIDKGEDKVNPTNLIAQLMSMGMSPEQINEFFSKLDPKVIASLNLLSSRNPFLSALIF